MHSGAKPCPVTATVAQGWLFLGDKSLYFSLPADNTAQMINSGKARRTLVFTTQQGPRHCHFTSLVHAATALDAPDLFDHAVADGVEVVVEADGEVVVRRHHFEPVTDDDRGEGLELGRGDV